MKGKVGSDYAERAKVKKIDTECLKWFLDEQKISLRTLSEKTSVSDRTIRNWLKREEMPEYLIDEICEALALESICDMRENPETKCAEPITTFRYIKGDNDKIKLHARIGVEIEISRDLLEKLLHEAIGREDEFAKFNSDDVSTMSFSDETAKIFLSNGKVAWDHYIPSEWLIEDGLRSGVITALGYKWYTFMNFSNKKEAENE